MIIKEVLLPTNINIDITGGPQFNNTVIDSGAGWRHTNINWSAALWSWTVRYHRRKTSFDPLISFFLAMKGDGYGFLFFDWTDHTSVYEDREQGLHSNVGKVRLIGGKYRLVKEYPDPEGGEPYTRIIQRPKPGTVVLDGVPGNPTVNHRTGVVDGATGEGSASFEFLVPVCFSSGKMQFQQDPSGVTTWTEIGIEEVRVTDEED